MFKLACDNILQAKKARQRYPKRTKASTQSRLVHDPLPDGLTAANVWMQKDRGEPVLEVPTATVEKRWSELGKRGLRWKCGDGGLQV